MALHEASTIADAVAEERLAGVRRVDADIWIVEVEDRCGAHGLDGWLATDLA
jgi:hypothetical protein